MVILFHDNRHVFEIHHNGSVIGCVIPKEPVAKTLIKTAQDFPDEWLIWCHEDLKSYLNFDQFETIFHHKKIMASFNPTEGYFPSMIGYVEDSPFIKINKKVTYPTWQMSGWEGGMHASVINALAPELSLENDFTYSLSSLAKNTMPLGLLCYSEPKLLKEDVTTIAETASLTTVYKFVSRHYKKRWLWLLFLNRMLYERKWDVVPFLKALWNSKKSFTPHVLDHIEVNSSRQSITDNSIDVIIPTIGRKSYLYEVLHDLKQQTVLPNQVIIIEQNPDKNSNSELDYLTTEAWPFKIVPQFIHQTGACNARNVAFAYVSSEWVFLADDDIRLKADFLEKAFEQIRKFGSHNYTFLCHQPHEKSDASSVVQWGTFGSGCSIIKWDASKKLQFNTAYEFGFGEDADFGMQLRNLGHDILYVPNPSIIHLKAPMGGFRTKFKLAWENEVIQPKPSPTVLLFKLLHQTKEQLFGYKTILFFKYYSKQPIKNPIKYYFHFQQQWKQSVLWANRLKQP